MKLSRYPDGSRATELTIDEDDNSLLHLHGDAVITATNSVTGELSTVAEISQHGSLNYIQRPRVAGEEVALKSETGVNLSTIERTVLDNTTTLIALCPVQDMVTVLYSFTSQPTAEIPQGADEKGVLTITEHLGAYTVRAEQSSVADHFAPISFSAIESNGSLLLNLIGSGQGLISSFKYRVNTVQTLY